MHTQSNVDQVFAALEGQTDLQTVNLSRNRLAHLPRVMCSWTDLRQMDLSQNVLHQLPNCWCSYPNLEVLDLRNNQLRQLPASIQKLQQLRVLYLNNNMLEELPAVLGQLHQLEELHLVNALQVDPQRRQLLDIPPEWAGLRSLKKIHLYEPSIQIGRALYRPMLRRLLPDGCVINLAYA